MDKALLKAAAVFLAKASCSFTGKHEGNTTLRLYRSVHEDCQGACVLDKMADPQRFAPWEEA